MRETIPATESSSIPTDTAQVRWSDVSLLTYLKIVILAVLFYSFFYEEINGIVRQWLDPSWSHGFLIPLFSLYLLHTRKEDILPLEPKPSYVFGLGGLIFFLVLYVLNIVQFKFGYGRPIIMLAALGSLVLFLSGWKIFKFTWLPVFFLYFAIPLPSQLYTRLTMPLRLWAAQVSSLILSFIPGLQATCQGVIIDIQYKGQHLEPGLDVAEACSGMRLLWAFLALGVLMAYLHKRPAWQRVILLGSTIPIAIICNILRVTVTGLIYIFGNPQYAQGRWHDMLGNMMIFVAFLLYGGLAWLMSNLFVEEEDPEEVVITRSKPSSALPSEDTE